MPYLQRRKSGQLKRLLQLIESRIYTVVAPLQVKAWVTPEPVSFADRMSGKVCELRPGDKWGELWDCAWFHFTGQVPATAQGRHVVLLIDINGEACVVDNAGNPLQGLTNVNSGFDYSLGKPGKRVVDLYRQAQGAEVIDLWADAGCNDLFGKYQGNGTLKEANIAVCHDELRGLYYDMEVLLELCDKLPESQARRAQIYAALDAAAAEIGDFTDDEARQARAILQPELAKRNGDVSLTISAIGHAHIDLAWLWPLRETIRKGARTFSTALYMMDRYPDYIFGASQPQLYAWIKQYYPVLYHRVKQRIAEGRWEAQGAMWVEADTNVSGGEALVRQLLYGKRFFRQEFGQDIRVLWLPDVFGYSGALPQLLRKSGVDYFMTIKLSWSEHNRFPHHTFHWEGIDGSRVLAHMPPEGTYNSSAAPRAIMKAESEYLDKGVSDRCLTLFGIGDGGGGPGEEHLERLVREKDLAGLAPVQQEPAIDFFRRLEKDAHRYATWYGELYLEKHQGTFTTQARSKRFNRKIELALRDLEFASTLAMLVAGAHYPQAELDEIWQEVLLYQFHDILPGSSIGRVYAESLQRYAALLERVQTLTAEAYRAIAAVAPAAQVAHPLLVLNSLSWDRREWRKTAGGWVQIYAPAMGYAVVDCAVQQSAELAAGHLTATPARLENDLLCVTIAADGSISSVYDKEHRREALSGPGNVLAVYQDTGDAWDFPMSYSTTPPQRFTLMQTQAHIDGPEAVVTQTYAFGNSRLTQQLVLTLGSRRLEFSTEVDWRENGKMLRTSFPVQVFTRTATCEIQFGNIQRPTHANTSWDAAKFEVPAHKWVDLSQGDYGVALLNDCKYGHKVRDNILDLNLLRSPSYPDPQADRAQHRFTYALYPHAGDYQSGGVVRAAYELNVPMLAVSGQTPAGNGARVASLVSVDAPNIVVETVKKAEDGAGFIVRLYECHGRGARARIRFGVEVHGVRLVNLMEEPVNSGRLDPVDVQLEFGPFEIHTLRVT